MGLIELLKMKRGFNIIYIVLYSASLTTYNKKNFHALNYKWMMSLLPWQPAPLKTFDVHSMSVSQSCLCPFLPPICNPYITLQIS